MHPIELITKPDPFRMTVLNSPSEADVKRILQKLFDDTQTNLARAIGAWVLIPFTLAMSTRGMNDIALTPSEIFQSRPFSASFPYVVAFAAMLCVAGCFRVWSAKLKRENTLCYCREQVIGSGGLLQSIGRHTHPPYPQQTGERRGHGIQPFSSPKGYNALQVLPIAGVLLGYWRLPSNLLLPPKNTDTRTLRCL
ncbi:hypothetical protein MD26_12380 [Pseudomonas sp. H2]|nr:hypothetical protein MD26_12380 [Pseudomonas sp. H2]